jgi:hypothetical protein
MGGTSKPVRPPIVKAAGVNDWDVRPTLERIIACRSGRIVRNTLITAPGPDPAPRAAYLRAPTEHAGHPVAASTPVAGDASPGLDDSHHRCSHGVREIGPGGNDDSEVTIRLRDIGSAFGSSHRTRRDAGCRLLTRFAFVVARLNLFCSSGLRRDLSRCVATRRKFTKSGGGGNCTREPRNGNPCATMPLRQVRVLLAGDWLGTIGVRRRLRAPHDTTARVAPGYRGMALPPLLYHQGYHGAGGIGFGGPEVAIGTRTVRLLEPLAFINREFRVGLSPLCNA